METERVPVIKAEEDQEERTIPVMKTEPKVSCVPVVSVTRILYRLCPELHAGLSVCPYETKI